MAALSAALVNAAILVGARWRVSDYWEGKHRVAVPGIGEYKDAERLTMEVVVGMTWMVVCWDGVGVLGLLA